jgi:Domain of Unknown Function (DUF1080)
MRRARQRRRPPALGIVWLLVILSGGIAPAEDRVSIFNGKDLTGWEGNMSYWSVVDGVIVGKLESAPVSTYLVTKQKFRDFRLICTVKQVVRNSHSGIAYWGWVDPEEDWTYHGHLAMFPHPWGIWELYGRESLVDGSKTPAPQVGKDTDWNTMEILCLGDRVRVAVNGTLCVDFTDPEPWRLTSGPIGLQLHSGGKTEIQFKKLRLSKNPSDRMLTVRSRPSKS